MQRKLFLVVGVALLSSLLAFAQDKPTAQQEKNELPTTTPEVSKALGVAYANMVREFTTKAPGGSELDIKLILGTMQGVLLDNKEAVYNPEQATAIVQNYIRVKNDEKAKENLQKGKKFLEENAKKEGVKTTKSGLQYLVTNEGQGPTPTVEDTVVVNYKGMLLDGTEFDSSYKRGEPVRFNPLQVIPGWTEGLCLMPKGSKVRLFIPSELAYGERGIGTIPPNSVLIFDIEMLDIIKGEGIPMAEPASTTNSEATNTKPQQPEADNNKNDSNTKPTTKK